MTDVNPVFMIFSNCFSKDAKTAASSATVLVEISIMKTRIMFKIVDLNVLTEREY